MPVDTTPGWAVKKEIIAGGIWTLFPSGKCRRDMLAQASLWATSQIQTQKLHFWYDERNLPVQIGDNEYRYTADGQRYYKKVGTVEEYYIMDDNLTAGVFSNTGTGYEPDYWNILAHGVEGKVLPDNTRRYYYKDHLGSTRMVVNEAGDAQSATDYYPFGMFMEGRSMASDAAKEGFTG